MRPNQGGPMQKVNRPNQPRMPVRPPAQPIIRTFPLPRPQGRPPSRMASPQPSSSAAGKQIFGPNSAVTISVANKKRMESQMRASAGAESQMRAPGGAESQTRVSSAAESQTRPQGGAESQLTLSSAQRPGRDDYARNLEKEGK